MKHLGASCPLEDLEVKEFLELAKGGDVWCLPIHDTYVTIEDCESYFTEDLAIDPDLVRRVAEQIQKDLDEQLFNGIWAKKEKRDGDKRTIRSGAERAGLLTDGRTARRAGREGRADRRARALCRHGHRP